MVEAIQARENRYYSLEEYLELEEKADYKSEYYDGQIIPMTGGSINHNRIALNVSVALSIGLKGQAYDVFIGDVRLWIPKKRIFTYPDVMVISGQPEYFNERNDTVTNPQVVIEVLSKSTKNYDRGDKFESYRTIPTLQEYILIDQEKIHIEQFYKTDHKKWSLCEYDDQDLILTLIAFQLELPIVEIYNKVNFENVE